ncbi:MAG: hypothetical protein JWO94_3068 [Verrucomicrobiaceae bacterium]|nr:hypothetical protein [Verrucomicrobiaceae bacterium]
MVRQGTKACCGAMLSGIFFSNLEIFCNLVLIESS